MSNPIKAAESLVKLAISKAVNFPKVFDESKLKQVCGAVLVLNLSLLQLKYTSIFMLHLCDFFYKRSCPAKKMGNSMKIAL